MMNAIAIKRKIKRMIHLNRKQNIKMQTIKIIKKKLKRKNNRNLLKLTKRNYYKSMQMIKKKKNK